MLGQKQHNNVLATLGKILELEKVQYDILLFDGCTEKKLIRELKNAELFFMCLDSYGSEEAAAGKSSLLCRLESLSIGYMLAHKGYILFFSTNEKLSGEVFSGEPIVGSIGEALGYFRREKKVFDSNKKLLDARRIISDAHLSFSSKGMVEAVEYGMYRETQAFLDAGFSTETETSDGVPLLNIAVRNGDIEICRLLMSYGASLNLIARDRCTSPVIDAVTAVKPEIAELLINNGADINFKNKNGQSALIVAIGSRMDEISHLLIDKGADVTIKDSLGMTASGYAKLFSMNEIYEKLESIV